jgi:peptide deformylase
LAIMKISTVGALVLKQKAKSVEKITDEIKELAKNMGETMKAAGGLGLAGPQVGVSLRIVVMDFGYLRYEKAQSNGDESVEDVFEPVALINPMIIEKSGEASIAEGCLSVPGYRAEVERASKVKAKYTDIDGIDHTVEAEGLMAIAFQHEIDHLDGILFIDRIGSIKRKIAVKKVKKYIENVKENGDEVESTLYG